ncbi:DUF6420 family protein [Streptomyces sp. ERV7]|uniref:DUF6420 family protein n=1 Tax=Streptomyces sp. ERV7 TaxID=1322334 RepID=UPI003B63E611
MLRSFPLRTGSIDRTAFIRAAHAIELGEERPVDLLLKNAEALAGPVRRADPQAEDDQAQASRGGLGPTDLIRTRQGPSAARGGLLARTSRARECSGRARPGQPGSGPACRARRGSPHRSAGGAGPVLVWLRPPALHHQRLDLALGRI